MQQHRKNSWQVLWQQQPEKKTTSKVGGKNKNSSLYVLEERANYKTSWLCGFNKASQRAWSRVRFGVQRMWVVSFSVHKQAVSVHPCTPQYTQRGRIVAVTSTNKLLCDSLAPLTLLKQTRALCPFFRAPLSALCICDKKMEHLTIFKHYQRGICMLYGFCTLYFSVTRESTSSLDYNIV